MRQSIACIAVAGGGAIGSVMRYLLSTWFVQRFGIGLPWGTFFINVSGAFVIGLVLQYAAMRTNMSPYLRLFLATGLLGGYTTFSTFAYEIYALSSDKLSAASVIYAAGSVVLGVAAALAGIAIVRSALS